MPILQKIETVKSADDLIPLYLYLMETIAFTFMVNKSVTHDIVSELTKFNHMSVGFYMTDISHIQAFLLCETPDTWIQNALNNQDMLLIDHANCEKKAASTALNLMYRYVDDYELLHKMSRLAREELRHFEQVMTIMEKKASFINKLMLRAMPLN